MSIPAKTLNKMQELPLDKMSIVIDIVDQLTLKDPLDIFYALCDDGSKNPMSQEEIDDFVLDARRQANASCS